MTTRRRAAEHDAADREAWARATEGVTKLGARRRSSSATVSAAPSARAPAGAPPGGHAPRRGPRHAPLELSAEDRAEWAKAVESVKRLGPATPRVPKTTPRRAPAAATRVPMPVPFAVADDGERVEGAREGEAPSVLARLRRGEFPIQAKLDLHGMRESEAERAVAAFLAARHAAGDAAVVVVHGRGRGSEGGRSVLRDAIAGWLSAGRAAGTVRAFATAGPDRGGAGATLVLLAGPAPQRRPR